VHEPLRGAAMVKVRERAEFRTGKFYPQMLWGSPRARVLLLCLEAGQALRPCRDPAELICYIMEGKGKITVGEQEFAAGGGCLVTAPPGETRGIAAQERMMVLLVHLSEHLKAGDRPEDPSALLRASGAPSGGSDG